MKKSLSLFIALVFMALSVLCVPYTSYAQEENEPVYSVSSKIYADAYMLINLDDSEFPVIAAKNQTKKKYPASLTKIVTAMVTLNNVKDLSAKTTVSDSAILVLANTGAQVAGLKAGDKVTIEELLYLTMVHSACDACEVLAEYVGGTITDFVKMMNDWCKSIGCENTNFVNPDGLHSSEHYTTAEDMAKITLEALKNETFVKIATTQQYKFNNMTLIHTNYMLDKFHITYYYEYAQGIKTGSTTEAGYCVITKAAKDGYNYLAIVMDSPIKKLKGIDTKCSFIDAGALFDWAFDSLKYSTVIRKNDLVTEIPVENGKDADTVQLVADEDVTTLVPVSLDPSAVIIRPVDAPETLEAPISQGDSICKAEVVYADKVIARVNLVTAKAVELSTFLTIMNAVKGFFGQKIVLAVLLVLILLVVLYIVIFANRLRKDNRRIAEKRRRQRELDEQINREYYGDDYISPPKRRR